jgi:hypothetical protein
VSSVDAFDERPLVAGEGAVPSLGEAVVAAGQDADPVTAHLAQALGGLFEFL